MKLAFVGNKKELTDMDIKEIIQNPNVNSMFKRELLIELENRNKK